MKKIAILGVVFLFGASTGWIAPRLTAWLSASLAVEKAWDQPLSPAVWEARESQFELLDPHTPSPSLVYLGDSLTDFADVEELMHFDGGAVINRGIQGDTTSAILRRIKQSFPHGASVVILLAGYNNVTRGGDPGPTAGEIKAICDYLIRERNVDHVVIESVPPGTDERRLPQIQALNARLAEIEPTDERISFLDLFPHLCSGVEPNATLYVDHIHLNAAGIQHRLQLEMDHLRRVCPDVGSRLTLITEKGES